MSEINTEGQKATVKPGQNIVASMAQDFRDELKVLLSEGVTAVAIDMTGVKIVDSMGLGVLVAIHNSLQKFDSRLEIINAADNIIKLMKEMRLDHHFILTD